MLFSWLITSTKFLFESFRNLASIQDREICCYSISCKEKENIGMYNFYHTRLTEAILLSLQHFCRYFTKGLKMKVFACVDVQSTTQTAQ